ncbi:MAG: DUF4058 family protein [Gemmataceae bacterium]|nr:DUF4058 family protein [Gemmataceae bacterium]
MPLLDHFHPPWKTQLPWDSLHSGWATHVAENLNTRWLPAQYLALEHTHTGPHVEIDVATFERKGQPSPPSGNGGAVATVPQTWAPPAAICAVPLTFPDRFEVRVYAGNAPWDLVGAIEFVSPGNKDRPEERQAFAIKCASYLHQGISVVLIDVVTTRRANLHNELLRIVNVTEPSAFLPDDTALYAAAYRPAMRGEDPECDVWHQPCVVGQSLPVMPLRLTGDLFVPVDFEVTYMETCRGRRAMG